MEIRFLSFPPRGLRCAGPLSPLSWLSHGKKRENSAPKSGSFLRKRWPPVWYSFLEKGEKETASLLRTAFRKRRFFSDGSCSQSFFCLGGSRAKAASALPLPLGFPSALCFLSRNPSFGTWRSAKSLTLRLPSSSFLSFMASPSPKKAVRRASPQRWAPFESPGAPVPADGSSPFGSPSSPRVSVSCSGSGFHGSLY